ncbi:3'-5' exonuclease [Allonocardiopsis opalescens]|uniref:DNA polymerase-3 subunit epsilon n=1 Tax=Allonocardiopsis opalescens TaxID=1144618 RepID=A0A2T0PWB6_9ACTN|nr:3'-5' exonuclease [Allonocardiopsis opalescens]PRX95720.1 DNA polymerase-3 subunit epsilon [Allonocardiopsis opalescens]
MINYGRLTRARGGADPRRLDYAVIDVETTGLDPAEGARVCEIAVVRMHGDGTVQREYATLVDPGVPVLGTAFHGITDGDVAAAPSVRDIAGDLTELLSGAVLVGHKLEFEESFLAAQFAPEGLPGELPGLCTLRAVRSQLDLPRYSLAQATHALTAHWPTGQHTALGDARACAQLLAELIGNAPRSLHYAGPTPRQLTGPPPSGRVKERGPLSAAWRGRGAEQELDGSHPRVLDGRPALRHWTPRWRALELDPSYCGGPFTPAERAVAVEMAELRHRRRRLTGLAAAAVLALGGGAVGWAAVRALRAPATGGAAT